MRISFEVRPQCVVGMGSLRVVIKYAEAGQGCRSFVAQLVLFQQEREFFNIPLQRGAVQSGLGASRYLELADSSQFLE